MTTTPSTSTAPQGFIYDPETREWDGPKGYAVHGQLGAWTTWTPELEIVVTVDTAGDGIMYTVDELRAFHAAMGELLAKVDAA